MDEKQIAALREVFEKAIRDDGYSEADDGPMALEHAWAGFLACYQHLAQWQPIETAPKDGMLVLLGRPPRWEGSQGCMYCCREAAARRLLSP